jgi:pimeloyl-ACP methyl ester carboxylesterase
VGFSQGATRAVDLARRFPAKYPWIVLVSGPSVVSPQGLGKLRGAYLFVGQHESQAAMRGSQARLSRAGLHADLRIVQGAGHADYHGQGDPLMKQAFEFLGVLP